MSSKLREYCLRSLLLFKVVTYGKYTANQTLSTSPETILEKYTSAFSLVIPVHHLFANDEPPTTADQVSGVVDVPIPRSIDTMSVHHHAIIPIRITQKSSQISRFL